MWSLEPPDLDTEDTYRTCISKVRNRALKARLEAVAPQVVLAAEEYEQAAIAAELHTIEADDTVGGVTKQEMAAVYKGRMVPGGSPGRPTYDVLLASSPHDRCPLCGQRVVSTLDHHLPKAHYPVFAVTPINLVPACKDCNGAKLDAVPQAGDEVTLHPYFDDIQDDRWLFAEVVEVIPAAVRFFVVPHESWDAITTARVQLHFRVLKLATLYAAHAGEELVSNRYYLSQLLANAGAATVQAHIRDMAESRAHAYTNSWQTAAYEAFAESQWFCSGGFQ